MSVSLRKPQIRLFRLNIPRKEVLPIRDGTKERVTSKIRNLLENQILAKIMARMMVRPLNHLPEKEGSREIKARRRWIVRN
jgi:hypothetical protein